MKTIKHLKEAAVLGCVGMMAAGMISGCGSTTLDYDASATIATFGDTAITSAEASYYIRLVQYSYEYTYAMYGSSMTGNWDTAYDGYVTYGQTVKETGMNEVYQTYVLCDKAESLGISLTDEQISQAHEKADEFSESYADTLMDAAGLTSDDLYSLYEKNALANLVYNAVVADVDTNVSDEEARHCAVSVVTFSDSSEDYNSEEAAAAVKAALDDGTSLDDAIADYADYNVTSSSYTVGEGDYTDSFGEAALELQTGEYATVHSDDSSSWYVIYCTDYMDADATEDGKTTIINERKSEMFTETYSEWIEDAPEFTVDEDVLESIDLDIAMYTSETSGS